MTTETLTALDSDNLSYRGRPSGLGPMSRSGYAMFADDLDSVLHYAGTDGQVYAVSHVSLVVIDELAGPISAAWDADSDSRPDGYEVIDSAEIVSLFDPSDIVDSAGGYDDERLTAWLWTAVLEPQNIVGIKTQDGAVVFSANLIRPLTLEAV